MGCINRSTEDGGAESNVDYDSPAQDASRLVSGLETILVIFW